MVKSLNIGIIMQGNDNWIAGIIYIQNLIKAIATLPIDKKEQFKVYLLIGSDLDRKHYETIVDLVDNIYIDDCLSISLTNRIIWKLGSLISIFADKRLVKLLKDKGIDFVYPLPNFLGISLDFECHASSWIPDLQHKNISYFFLNKEIEKRDNIFGYIAGESKNIIFSSNTALNDFNTFYPQSKANKFVLQFRSIAEPSWFIDETSPRRIQEKYQLPDIFFIVSNQFWIHKNHRLIIESLILLKKERIYPTVVCTGKLYDYRFPQYVEEIKQLIKNNDLTKQFVILGLISRWEQMQLMRRSLAVIQPSLFEGWSTVVEDAKVLGKVVILSDIPVHLEQNPPKAIFFNRNSSEDLAKKIRSILIDLKNRNDLIAELEAKENNKIEGKFYAEQFLEIVLKTCLS